MRVIVENTNPLPAYLQVKEQIRRFIEDNALPPGSKVPDIKTIARNSNVSYKTIFLGLDELVKDGICIRRPKKGTFVGNFQAEPASVCSLCLLWHPDEEKSLNSNIMVARFYSGIRQSAKDSGIDCLFVNGEIRKSLLAYTRSAGLKTLGLLVLNPANYAGIISLAEDFPSVKIIYLGHFFKDFETTPPNVYGVFSDEFSGAYQLAEHLIGKGHRKMAVVVVDIQLENYRQRVAGYREAVKNHIPGMTPEIYTINPENGPCFIGDYEVTGRELVARILKESPDVTAIMAVNDPLAYGIELELVRRGIQDRIAVTGYDRIHVDLCARGNFSTVAVDFEGLGYKAVDILKSSGRNIPKTINLQPQLYLK